MMFLRYSSVLAVIAGSFVCATQLPLVDDAVNPCKINHTLAKGQPAAWAHVDSIGGGNRRSFLVYVPASYQVNTPMGMILSFHGRGKTAHDQQDLSQFSNEMYHPDWLAVYPQGVREMWEGPDYNDNDISDVKFIKDLLAYMRLNYCIDDSKIYASGKSIGGGFTGILACNKEVGGNFAAFAPVSGAFYRDLNSDSPCTPARNITPIIEFHGFADDKIPYDGGAGEGGPTPPIPAWLQRWAGRNGNHTIIVPSLDNHSTTDISVYHSSWDSQGQSGIVQGYNISNLGHMWPTTKNTVMDATPIILDFFKKNPKPSV